MGDAAESRGWHRREIAILCGIVIAALLIRAWLIPGRWVNPDEGAHLMDGRLVLEGLVPEVDFDSRQPLYVYLTGLAVWILGIDLFHLRYFPVVVTLLAGIVVHLIGRRLFGWKSGLVASALFLLLPFSAFMTVYTKTEPLAILTTAGAVYFVLKARSEPERVHRWLFLSGTCLGAAFYVRQSTVAVLGALLLAVLIERTGRGTSRSKALGSLLLGAVAVSLVVTVHYLRFIPIEEIWGRGEFNPVSFVTGNVKGALVPLLEPAAEVTGIQTDRLSYETTLENFLVSARVCVVLAIAAGWSVVAFSLDRVQRRSGDHSASPSLDLLLLWTAALGLAYLFWTAKRGFYPAYFLELVPPLTIMASGGIIWCWRNLPGQRTGSYHLLALGVLAAIFGVAHLLTESWQISRPLYFLVTAPVMAAFYLAADEEPPGVELLTRWAPSVIGVTAIGLAAVVVGPELPSFWGVPFYLGAAAGVLGVLLRARRDVLRKNPLQAIAFGAYSLILAGLFLALSESGVLLDLRYHSVWSPETVERASEVLEDHTVPGATVASGGVIWEFQADRPPFARVAHPLTLRAVTPTEKSRLQQELSRSPPAAVVLDGYTEQTYFSAVPGFELMLDRDFGQVAVIGGSRSPVRIYLRTDDAEIVPAGRIGNPSKSVVAEDHRSSSSPAPLRTSYSRRIASDFE